MLSQSAGTSDKLDPPILLFLFGVTHGGPGDLHFSHPARIGAGSPNFPEAVPFAVEKGIVKRQQIPLRSVRIGLKRNRVAFIQKWINTYTHKVIVEVVEITDQVGYTHGLFS